jgi:serine/threonine-protein kinase HipA
MTETEVEVYVQIRGEDLLAGRLWSHRRGKAESATFAYDSHYIARQDAYELDPALPLVTAQQQTAVGQKTFAAFSDCAPDRWGRRLIVRGEKRRVEREGGAERSFGEMGLLLGVRDDMRQGALRFRRPRQEVFLADEEAGVPHLIELPELLGAADALERGEASEEELRMLLRGGSSLGGARPKAHVIDGAGRAAIAKFPSPADQHDVIRWEAIALTLARAAGIDVPDWRLEPIDDKPVLIVRRFDREGERRLGYVSAMTMLEAVDGDGGSYLEIVDAIERHSPGAEGDLRQLWRRIAFTVLISNTDDHLRNHGFLRLSSAGWSLSPAFDLNPDPEPGTKHLSTSIEFGDTTASLETLMGVRDYFGLEGNDARSVLGEVHEATASWREAAASLGVDRAGIAAMESAFEHDQRELAKEIIAGAPTEGAPSPSARAR